MASNRVPRKLLAAGIGSESELVSLCVALIGGTKGLSQAERALAAKTGSHVLPAAVVETTRRAIAKGLDPLGDAFAVVRSALARRSAGAVYTPAPIVKSMMTWLASQGAPARIVDPGAGSGRFILAAGEAFPKAQL
ncbi:SAM-dependent methyltransferase, partial [Pseudomonas aeruginosa]